ncbi:hypothetical protein RMCBS344292_17080 [Rhizopus microsporus]|nr:hypothetical protein RMCBS344292_17080 [Rhizopus microsporus]
MKQDEDKLSYIDDFQEILQSEVYVDLERLRILARHGIPNQLRSEVWKYLLGVQQADRSKELSSCKARREEYEQMDKEDIEIAKRIRGEVLRYQRRVPDILQEKEYVNSFVNIILAYLNSNRDVEYSPNCYFAMSDPFAFHPFVCLSILLSVKEAVEDLEQSEIRTMLHRLPLLNMDMVIIYILIIIYTYESL